MAMIDYGAILKKNKVIINKNEMFMDMEKAVGFEIDKIEHDYWNKGEMSELKISHQYFVYMGDEELLVFIYKHIVYIVSNNKLFKVIYGLDSNPNLPFVNMVYNFNINGTQFHMKRLSEKCNRYKLRFEYKNNLYECLYGHGVDIDKNKWYISNSKEQRYVDKWYLENKFKGRD